MTCLMGGVGWHGTRLGRSDSDTFYIYLYDF